MKELESLNDGIDRIVVPDARNSEPVDAFRVSLSHIFHTDASKVPPKRPLLAASGLRQQDDIKRCACAKTGTPSTYEASAPYDASDGSVTTILTLTCAVKRTWSMILLVFTRATPLRLWQLKHGGTKSCAHSIVTRAVTSDTVTRKTKCMSLMSVSGSLGHAALPMDGGCQTLDSTEWPSSGSFRLLQMLTRATQSGRILVVALWNYIVHQARLAIVSDSLVD